MVRQQREHGGPEMLASLLLILLMQEAAAPPAPLPPPAVPPTAGRSNTITVKDYPSAARREGAEGNASVNYRVGASGSVESCAVISSSSSAALDAATCAIAKRWRFNPARDAQGNKVPSNQVLTIAWRAHDAGCKTDVPPNTICVSPD